MKLKLAIPTTTTSTTTTSTTTLSTQSPCPICLNGGYCMQQIASICMCPCFYTGTTCQICNWIILILCRQTYLNFKNVKNLDINPCASNPCQAGYACSLDYTCCGYKCNASKKLNNEF